MQCCACVFWHWNNPPQLFDYGLCDGEFNKNHISSQSDDFQSSDINENGVWERCLMDRKWLKSSVTKIRNFEVMFWISRLGQFWDAILTIVFDEEHPKWLQIVVSDWFDSLAMASVNCMGRIWFIWWRQNETGIGYAVNRGNQLYGFSIRCNKLYHIHDLSECVCVCLPLKGKHFLSLIEGMGWCRGWNRFQRAISP